MTLLDAWQENTHPRVQQHQQRIEVLDLKAKEWGLWHLILNSIKLEVSMLSSTLRFNNKTWIDPPGVTLRGFLFSYGFSGV
jgi:hypothetical protein